MKLDTSISQLGHSGPTFHPAFSQLGQADAVVGSCGRVQGRLRLEACRPVDGIDKRQVPDCVRRGGSAHGVVPWHTLATSTPDLVGKAHQLVVESVAHVHVLGVKDLHMLFAAVFEHFQRNRVGGLAFAEEPLISLDDAIAAPYGDCSRAVLGGLGIHGAAEVRNAATRQRQIAADGNIHIWMLRGPHSCSADDPGLLTGEQADETDAVAADTHERPDLGANSTAIEGNAHRQHHVDAVHLANLALHDHLTEPLRHRVARRMAAFQHDLAGILRGPLQDHGLPCIAAEGGLRKDVLACLQRKDRCLTAQRQGKDIVDCVHLRISQQFLDAGVSTFDAPLLGGALCLGLVGQGDDFDQRREVPVFLQRLQKRGRHMAGSAQNADAELAKPGHRVT
mmetsp:Transcript_1968/g.3817  ORF Transcript_1968/g.3817 Transcript_1968/m.3817 type:complete len:394 (-) Transcript_1968:77-1258(-)